MAECVITTLYHTQAVQDLVILVVHQSLFIPLPNLKCVVVELTILKYTPFQEVSVDENIVSRAANVVELKLIRNDIVNQVLYQHRLGNDALLRYLELFPVPKSIACQNFPAEYGVVQLFVRL